MNWKDTFYRKTTWIPGPAPLISIPTNLELISKTAKQHIVNFTFNVTGETLTSLTNFHVSSQNRNPNIIFGIVYRTRPHKYNFVSVQRCSSRKMVYTRWETIARPNVERQRDLLYLLRVCFRLCAIYIFYRTERKFARQKCASLCSTVLHITLIENFGFLCPGICGAERTVLIHRISRTLLTRRTPKISEI